MPLTISLRRTSRASRAVRISDIPYAPLSAYVQTSAPIEILDAKPRRTTCDHPAPPVKGLEGAVCGKSARYSATHVHGDWYRPEVDDETTPLPEEWQRDFGGEG